MVASRCIKCKSVSSSSQLRHLTAEAFGWILQRLKHFKKAPRERNLANLRVAFRWGFFWDLFGFPLCQLQQNGLRMSEHTCKDLVSSLLWTRCKTNSLKVREEKRGREKKKEMMDIPAAVPTERVTAQGLSVMRSVASQLRTTAPRDCHGSVQLWFPT